MKLCSVTVCDICDILLWCNIFPTYYLSCLHDILKLVQISLLIVVTLACIVDYRVENTFILMCGYSQESHVFYYEKDFGLVIIYVPSTCFGSVGKNLTHD